jgi:GT2 family glycosyltransferase
MAVIVVSLFLIPAALACLAYLVPTLAGRFWRAGGVSPLLQQGADGDPRSGYPGSPGHSFAVLVPAHDEEGALPRALASLASQDYPADRVRVVVVADNCSDGTAAVTRAAGVACLERTDADSRGKGYAIAFGLEHVLKDEPDAVLVLDADCELNPGALRALDAALARAEAVQAAVVSRNADDGPAGYVAAVGAAVDAAVAAGRDRLGFAVPLRGTGMAFRRDVLRRVPWAAFGAAEDAEYGAALRAAGMRVRLAAGAVVACESPSHPADLYRQRRRWRAALRTGRRWAASKPLVLAHLAATVAASAAVGLLPWAAVPVGLTAAVYLRAVVEVGFSRKRFGLLLRSPAVVLRLGWLSLAGLVGGKPAGWDRTPRPAGAAA